ncbi:MAG: adenosylcobinamide-GDP ribazoletransferase [Pseudomonadota bacterium]
MKSEAASFLLAVQFLTRVPIGRLNVYTPERMTAATRYYPLVGALVGGFCALMFVASDTALPTAVAVLLSIAAGLLLTGAFHEDGLADTFDGIGGGLTRERALEIMRDSRLGTYGTLALVTALAIKAAALISMPTVMIPAALITAHGLSRLSSIIVIATSRYVRDEGTGKPVAGGISFISLLVALVTGAAIVAIWCLLYPSLAITWALGAMVIGHGLMRVFFEPKLGGYTGDTLGAIQQASEIGFYLGLLAWV